MALNLLLFDVAVVPGGSVTGAAVGIVFFLVLAAAAFVAFKMLKRTVKMAIRMLIVAIILVVAIVGAISFMVFSKPSRSERPVPQQQRPR